MNLPGCGKELYTVFTSAAIPDLSALRGEYLVEICMIPGYRHLSHRKVFYSENRKILGYNVLFNKTWGYFNVEEGTRNNNQSLKVAIINYNRAENSYPVRRIRDHIRCVEQDKLYIGRAHYLLSGKEWFLGYFTLKRTGQ